MGGDNTGRKLSPNGQAALKRLEARERSAYLHQHQLETSFEYSSNNLATPESYQTTVLPSVSSTTSSISSGSNNMEATQTSEWQPPPTPRRVSLEASKYDAPSSNSGNVQFASPCKPEHVAMLQSIRQVSVQNL